MRGFTYHTQNSQARTSYHQSLDKLVGIHGGLCDGLVVLGCEKSMTFL